MSGGAARVCGAAPSVRDASRRHLLERLAQLLAVGGLQVLHQPVRLDRLEAEEERGEEAAGGQAGGGSCGGRRRVAHLALDGDVALALVQDVEVVAL